MTIIFIFVGTYICIKAIDLTFFIIYKFKNPKTPIEKYYKLLNEQSKFKIKRLHRMNYQDYLKTKHWQYLREAILYRDDYKCNDCKTAINLNVHHLTYKNKGHEQLTDLITLCHECHEEHHSILAHN